MKRDDDNALGAASRAMLLGHLSQSERRGAAPRKLSLDEAALAPADARLAREHYTMMLAVTKKARKELAAALALGLPPLTAYKSAAAVAPAVAACHAAVTRHANAFAWASRSLWNAAAALCIAEGLEDEGAEAGIVWECKL